MEEMGLPVLELIQFVDTRWSSEYNMLSRLHAVRKAVGAELANSENNIEVLTAVEWKQAAGIVEVLGPLADATKEISGDSYPTSSMVIPILHCLKSHLNVFITSKKDGVMFARSLDKALKSRFSFYDSDPIFCPSMLCDPRFRGVLIDDMVAVNTLAIEVKKLSDKSSLEPNTELEEIESRNEEFPLTRALLHLMDVLTNLPVPRLLGAGSRNPGFDPYLQFIMNSVFLRFNTRTYKNPGEKWEVANGCLKLLVKFVSQYEPHFEDFVGKQVELQGGGLTQVNPPSGFHLMVALNSKSELIRLVLYIIHEGCQLLDSYSPFPAKEMLESCTLLCLQLIQKALNLQQRFLSLLSSAGSNLLLTGLSKLLLDVNPRSGQPDNLLNITKDLRYFAKLGNSNVHLQTSFEEKKKKKYLLNRKEECSIKKCTCTKMMKSFQTLTQDHWKTNYFLDLR
uniref:Uncharacterized protein n=1 Tax=Timema bartmani TaxID=61472 RepID=A0A7R9EYM0_9NEOP|nr:unnamed protein product [Timema bartmani]